MKIIIMSLFILFSLFSIANAKATKHKNKTVSPLYRNVLCKQKYIPMKIEQTLNSHLLRVKFSAQRKIDQFSINNVRGIEGVTVTKFQEQNQSGIESGDVLTSDVELSDFKGLAYVVFDVSITVDGMTTGHSIPVPVGKLSSVQKIERAKNIKEVKIPTQNKPGESSLSVPVKKIHEMQAQ